MSNEYENYQDVSGVQPWVPPPDYVSPVPPARGDATPAGHARSLLAGLRSGRDDAGDATSTVRWLIIVIVIALGIWFWAVPWVEDQIDRGNDLLDDIEQTIEDARESIEGTAGTESSNADSGATGKSPPAADGKSNLPGRFASLTYSVLDNETEFAQRQNVDSPYDGSNWSVSRFGDDGSSFMMLSHYTFVPPLATKAQRETFADAAADSIGAKPGTTPERRTIQLDGRTAYEYRFEKASGTNSIVVYVLGKKHSYRFDCDAAKSDDEFFTSCERALKSLRFRR